MARKVDEAANFASMQLTELELGIYVRCHPDYAKQDEIAMAWERISHEMDSGGGGGGVCVCVCVCVYIYIIIKTYNRMQIQNRSVIASHQRDWDKRSPLFLLAYWASTHDTTGLTPDRLVFR
jgi:hypothetical protein